MQKGKFIKLKNGNVILVTAINAAHHVGHGININSPYAIYCNFSLEKVASAGTFVTDADHLKLMLARAQLQLHIELTGEKKKAMEKRFSRIHMAIKNLDGDELRPYATN